MKKFLIFLFAAVLAVGTAGAQDRNERQRVNPRTVQNIEGILKLERGVVAVQSGESVYLVPILTRYIGFINGLKEDEKISIEGHLFRNIIHPVKVTIADKSYDFFAPGHELGMLNNNFGYTNYPYPNQRQLPRHMGHMRGHENHNNRQNWRNLPNRY